MSENDATATVEVPTADRKPEASKPKPLPPHAVIVLNDDEHSFDYVIHTFQKVFGYSTEKAYLLALTIHTEGRANVWSGSKEVAELKRDQVRSAGPDIYASKRVDWPLGVVVEPLPG